MFLAAAKVGGIVANNRYPAEFIRDNLAIQTNVIHAAWKAGVQRLLFLGSSCIYPKLAPQPMKESCLLTGPLEPTNLYGPGDNYHPTNGHVIPALIRKFHEAKQRGDASVTVWGTGTPRREFLYSDDMADACVFLMGLSDERYTALLGSDETVTGRFEPPLVNIGVGHDVTIAELAEQVRLTVGFEGGIVYDSSQPDGTPRKLMDVGLINAAGWRASTPLKAGLATAYAEFRASHR